MTSDTEYQLVMLKRAVGRNGVVCRLHSDSGTVRVDVFWSPPRMQRKLRPFASLQPLSLLQDFTSNGFARVDDETLEDLAKTGILVVSFASEAKEGADLARSIINRHGLGRSDRVVAWKTRRAVQPSANRSLSPPASEPKRAAGDGW